MLKRGNTQHMSQQQQQVQSHAPSRGGGTTTNKSGIGCGIGSGIGSGFANKASTASAFYNNNTFVAQTGSIRNRFLYIQSVGDIVVQSNHFSGGGIALFNGAQAVLSNTFSDLHCLGNCLYFHPTRYPFTFENNTFHGTFLVNRLDYGLDLTTGMAGKKVAHELAIEVTMPVSQ